MSSINEDVNNDEKRQFTRVPFVTQVRLSQDEQLWLGHVIDISFKGILVSSSTPFTFNEEQPVVTEISFDNGSSMKIKAQQAHNNGQFYGFKFLEVDVDGMTHLRNIIMLNLGDDAACERELISLFSYHQ
ncbi:MAG: PilZ domain-containing protein [Cellvibrionaceae bacterium]